MEANLESLGRDDSDVRWDPISRRDFDDVANGHLKWQNKVQFGKWKEPSWLIFNGAPSAADGASGPGYQSLLCFS